MSADKIAGAVILALLLLAAFVSARRDYRAIKAAQPPKHPHSDPASDKLRPRLLP